MTGGGGRLRGLLVIGEVATAVLLLFGAGLLLRTLIAVEGFDRGYRAESVLSMLVDPLGSKYPTARIAAAVLRSGRGRDRRCSGRRGRRLGERAAARLLRRRAGSRSRSSATLRSTTASGRAPSIRWSARRTSRRSICRSWPDAPSIARDTRDGVPVCIVNEAFARSFHGRSPIGQRVALRPTVVAAGEARSCARSSASRGR